MPPNNPLDEVPLSGGNMTRVVRVGDTVRREAGPWSETIHALMLYLEAKGFDGAPRFLGIDDQGREIISFIEGDTGFVPYRWDDDVLVGAARLLRRFHDATVGFVPPANAVWQRVHPDPRRHEVICHNDFAPYNLMFANRLPTAIIDFDLAGPGPRINDVAFGAYWFAPLQFGGGEEGQRALADLHNGCTRLRRFCREYGMDASPELIDVVDHLLVRMRDVIIEGVDAGDPVFIKLKAEGHLEGWSNDVINFRTNKAALTQALAR